MERLTCPKCHTVAGDDTDNFCMVCAEDLRGLHDICETCGHSLFGLNTNCNYCPHCGAATKKQAAAV